MSAPVRARPFANTLASVERSRWVWWGLVGAAMVGLWLAIAAMVPLPRYEPSLTGRLEVDGYPIVLQSTHGGRVGYAELQLEQRIEQGQVLLQLETRDLREEADRLQLRRAGLRSTLEAKERELAAAEQQIEKVEVQQDALLAELSVKKKARKTAAELAATRAQRVGELSDAEIGTAEEAERARAEARMAELGVEELGRSGRVTQAEFGTRITELQTSIAGLEASITETETALASLEIDIQTNQRTIEEHRIVAPVTGRLSRVTPLGEGSVVEAGAELAVLVAERPPIVRAEFSSRSAAGRLRAGQRARVRFDAFSWVEYGSVDAVVRAVGDEAVDGAIEVELELEQTEDAAMPLRHGQTCTVDVEVEEVTMLRALARSVGFLGQREREGSS